MLTSLKLLEHINSTLEFWTQERFRVLETQQEMIQQVGSQ